VTAGRTRLSPPVHRLAAIGAAVTLMVVGLVAVAEWLERRETGPAYPPPGPVGEFGDPIAAEAGVFRTGPEHGAVPAEHERRPEAHRRTHAMYRTLRAYAGAPPRIPHALTPAEFHDASCQTCHERGGYVARFTAYAPVTPHPEYRRGCLQCHALDDALVGIGPPDGSPGSECLQCHVPDRPAPVFVANDWRVAAWDHAGERALEGAPPTIPHDLQMRANCGACHIGAGAVEEIRTTHPERTNCRQCHMAEESSAAAFMRPLDRSDVP
jgi:nitrate reductase (cytochrome), electron transfer subunit